MRLMIDTALDQYNPDPQSPLANPISWPGGLAGLPPTYIACSGVDPLRDDSIIYEAALREAGVRAKIDVFAGCIHSQPGFEIRSPSTLDIVERMGAGMVWLLTGGH
jgi:acetyl esterase/lipase